ncbi:MAG: hypothetical protein AB4080_26890 [Trichodesmium sp.]
MTQQNIWQKFIQGVKLHTRSRIVTSIISSLNHVIGNIQKVGISLKAIILIFVNAINSICKFIIIS